MSTTTSLLTGYKSSCRRLDFCILGGTLMIITITREFGSGGRTIAKKLAEKLGYAYYDYEIVQQIAQESGFAKEYIEENGEDASSTSTFGFIWNNYGYNLSDELYIAQRNVICELADKGNCVIVGRCSDYILCDRKDVLNVFIHADFEYRKIALYRFMGKMNLHQTNESKTKINVVSLTINITRIVNGQMLKTINCV